MSYPFLPFLSFHSRTKSPFLRSSAEHAGRAYVCMYQLLSIIDLPLVNRGGGAAGGCNTSLLCCVVLCSAGAVSPFLRTYAQCF